MHVYLVKFEGLYRFQVYADYIQYDDILDVVYFMVRSETVAMTSGKMVKSIEDERGNIINLEDCED